jgi:hypothetical protein
MVCVVALGSSPLPFVSFLLFVLFNVFSHCLHRSLHHKHTNVHKHQHIRTRTHKNIHTQKRIYSHTNTNKHTHTHTHTHTIDDLIQLSFDGVMDMLGKIDKCTANVDPDEFVRISLSFKIKPSLLARLRADFASSKE